MVGGKEGLVRGSGRARGEWGGLGQHGGRVGLLRWEGKRRMRLERRGRHREGWEVGRGKEERGIWKEKEKDKEKLEILKEFRV